MQIIAYTNYSETNVMNKDIRQIGGAVTVKPTEQLDIETPTFIVNYSASLLNCNYIKCDTYNRFYFAKVTTTPGAEMKIECVSDPLMSFANEIRNCDILVTRSESIGQPTLYPDNQLPVYPSKKNITSIVMQHRAAPLSGDLSTSAAECYLLTVIGGQPHLNERVKSNESNA